MDQIREIKDMAKIVIAICDSIDVKVLRARDAGHATLIRKAALDGIRWHVKALYVVAFSDARVTSVPNDAKRAEMAQFTEEALVKIGNRIKAWTKTNGALHFPSEPFKDKGTD